MLFWGSLWNDDPAFVISWLVWIVVSITLHELAHGWAAIRRGDDTPIHTGHMTWNPIVHMGWPSVIMLALVGIAWGQMPVNPSRFKGRHADAAVAAAGPAMNFGLAVGNVLAAALWCGYAQGIADPLWSNFATFFFVGASANAALMVLNLVPIPPLDGSRIVASFSPGYRRALMHPQAGVISIVAFLVLLVWAGKYVMGPPIAISMAAIASVQSVLPGAKPFTGAFKSVLTPTAPASQPVPAPGAAPSSP